VGITGAGTIERVQRERLESGSGSVFARKLPCFEQMVGGVAEYGNREITQQPSLLSPKNRSWLR